MTDHSRAVQAIQAIALKYFPVCRIPEPSQMPLTGTIRSWNVGDDANEANRQACMDAMAEIEQVLRETLRLGEIRYYIEEAMASLQAPVHTDAAGRALTLLAESKKLLGESAPPKGDVAAPPQYARDVVNRIVAHLAIKHGIYVGQYWEELVDVASETEAPAEPVAQPQESIEAHQSIECRSRYCAQHRDIWRHYEDAIAKAEPVAPPPRNVQAQFDPLYDPNEAVALEQSAPPPTRLPKTVSAGEQLVTCKGQPEPHIQIHACREPIVVVQGEQASPPSAESPAQSKESR